MHIYVVRHTQYHNPDNLFAFHSPFHLSKTGRKHAQKIGDWFVEKRLNDLPIYSSPIVRCVQTSEIIASKTGSNVEIDDRLIETSCANLQGKTMPEKLKWELEEDDKSRESRSNILERVLNLYNEKVILNKDCIFVSHGDPTTFLYHHLTEKDLPKYLWNPENAEHIIIRGMIIDVEIKDNQIVDVTRITA